MLKGETLPIQSNIINYNCSYGLKPPKRYTNQNVVNVDLVIFKWNRSLKLKQFPLFKHRSNCIYKFLKIVWNYFFQLSITDISINIRNILQKINKKYQKNFTKVITEIIEIYLIKTFVEYFERTL